MNDQKSIADRMPSTVSLLVIFLFVATVFSQILPPGQFERESREIRRGTLSYEQFTVTDEIADRNELKDVIGVRLSPEAPVKSPDGEIISPPFEAGMDIQIPVYGTQQRQVVVPGTYERIPRPDDSTILSRAWNGVVSFLSAPMMGFASKTDIIAFVFILGGAFGMIMATGAIDAGLHRIVAIFGNRKSDWLIIPAIMVAFSFGGAVFGLSEEVIPFVMLTIPLALRLGYDTITGLCMSFLGAGLGFASAFFNPFTVGIAQGIAEVAPFSGSEFRFVVWMVMTSVGIVFVLRHAWKVKANPELSPTYELDNIKREELAAAGHENGTVTSDLKFGGRHLAVLLVLGATIIAAGWGVKTYGWWMTELGALFLAAGIGAGLLGGLGLAKGCQAFLKGAVDLAPAALIIAISGGIVSVLEQENILDTLLHGVASSIEGFAPTVTAMAMFFFQSLLNVIVPSGSGQAAMTMPIMAPLADILGVSRQTAVLAYQFGDGLTNMIIPTSAVTMSVLSIARISWIQWAKWLWPLEVILAIFACIFLAIAVQIGF